MILDTIARSAGKRVEQRKQVKPLEQVMKEAFKCREREGIKRKILKGKTEQAEDILLRRRCLNRESPLSVRLKRLRPQRD